MSIWKAQEVSTSSSFEVGLTFSRRQVWKAIQVPRPCEAESEVLGAYAQVRLLCGLGSNPDVEPHASKTVFAPLGRLTDYKPN